MIVDIDAMRDALAGCSDCPPNDDYPVDDRLTIGQVRLALTELEYRRDQVNYWKSR